MATLCDARTIISVAEKFGQAIGMIGNFETKTKNADADCIVKRPPARAFVKRPMKALNGDQQ